MGRVLPASSRFWGPGRPRVCGSVSPVSACLSSLGLLGVSYIPTPPFRTHIIASAKPLSPDGVPCTGSGVRPWTHFVGSTLHPTATYMGASTHYPGFCCGRRHSRCRDSEECLRPWGLVRRGAGGGIGICGLPPMGLPAQPGEKGGSPRLRGAPASGVLSAAVAGLPWGGACGILRQALGPREQVTPTGQRVRRVSRKPPACLSVSEQMT